MIKISIFLSLDCLTILKQNIQRSNQVCKSHKIVFTHISKVNFIFLLIFEALHLIRY